MRDFLSRMRLLIQHGHFWKYWRCKVQTPTCYCELSGEPHWGKGRCEICPYWEVSGMTPMEELELILHRVRQKHPYISHARDLLVAITEETAKFNKEKEKDAKRTSAE